jgi:hypothetical protein
MWCGVVTATGIGVMYLARQPLVTELHPYALFIVAILGTIIAVGGALGALYSVRCPKCRLAWLRWSMGHRPSGDWLHWLYRFEECPQCKYRAEGKASAI